MFESERESFIFISYMEGQSGQKEHSLILINDLLILINHVLILINHLSILILIYIHQYHKICININK